jgi:hypothetical protein
MTHRFLVLGGSPFTARGNVEIGDGANDEPGLDGKVGQEGVEGGLVAAVPLTMTTR